jgi:hypothetical protein
MFFYDHLPSHASSHMEEEIMRKHEKNAINDNKIAIIGFYINATSPFRGFDSRGFGRHRDFDHCSVSPKPESRNRVFRTFNGLRRSEIALLATESQDFRQLRYPCFRPVSCRNRRFSYAKNCLGKKPFFSALERPFSVFE